LEVSRHIFTTREAFWNADFLKIPQCRSVSVTVRVISAATTLYLERSYDFSELNARVLIKAWSSHCYHDFFNGHLLRAMSDFSSSKSIILLGQICGARKWCLINLKYSSLYRLIFSPDQQLSCVLVLIRYPNG
jgi:hypothetical protein